MAALPDSVPVAVVGAGTMGRGIAVAAASAGHPVLLYDSVPGAVSVGKDAIEAILQRSMDKGRIDSVTRDAVLSVLSVVDELDQLETAGMVVEAIVEDLEAKQSLFSTLEEVCGSEAILATNTSSLSITSIAAALELPGRLVGMHFFNPAHVMRLVEVVSGLATDQGVADTVFDTARAWGKDPVRVLSTPGFVVNRVARPFYAEALRIVGEGGANPATVDAVIRESGGFRMGPFELMDLIGNDVNAAVTHSVWTAFAYDPRFTPSLLQQELVAGGRLGRKSGRGWYDYGDAKDFPAPDTAAPAPAPESVLIEGGLGTAETLVSAIEAAGIPFRRTDSHEVDHGGAIVLQNAVLRLTNGKPATEIAAELDEGHKLVLFDLALDYGTASRIALAAADQTNEIALSAAVGLFQSLGKAVSVIDDVPAMITMRTVSMLANEAADAVNQGVADAVGVDVAMRSGVNYPEGPLAWADRVGVNQIGVVLSNLAAVYGEDRYRTSPLIKRKIWAGTSFHD